MSWLSKLLDPSTCDEKQSTVKSSVSTKGEKGQGRVGDEPALQGALRLRNRCQQVRKQQLELDMEQQTGSK